MEKVFLKFGHLKYFKSIVINKLSHKDEIMAFKCLFLFRDEYFTALSMSRKSSCSHDANFLQATLHSYSQLYAKAS